MADKRIYVEKRDGGDYAIRRAGSKRASDVKPTQAEAIERAKELEPGVHPHVERVRDGHTGGPDKWRKADGGSMKEPGLDARRHDKSGVVKAKRSDAIAGSARADRGDTSFRAASPNTALAKQERMTSKLARERAIKGRTGKPFDGVAFLRTLR